MLKVKNIVDCVPIRVLIDEYIPLKVVYGKWDPSLDSTAYWQLGDLQKNLIEIGLGENNGALRFIMVVLVENICKEKIIINCTNRYQGTPIFETEYFKKEYLFKQVGFVKLIMDGSKILLLFSKNEIYSQIDCDRTTFFLDQDNYFCGFMINLINREVDILNKNFFHLYK